MNLLEATKIRDKALSDRTLFHKLAKENPKCKAFPLAIKRVNKIIARATEVIQTEENRGCGGCDVQGESDQCFDCEYFEG